MKMGPQQGMADSGLEIKFLRYDLASKMIKNVDKSVDISHTLHLILHGITQRNEDCFAAFLPPEFSAGYQSHTFSCPSPVNKVFCKSIYQASLKGISWPSRPDLSFSFIWYMIESLCLHVSRRIAWRFVLVAPLQWRNIIRMLICKFCQKISLLMGSNWSL